MLAFAGAGSLLLLATSAGQWLGGPLRRTALLAPHGQDLADGPNGFQINQTAAEVGIRAETPAARPAADCPAWPAISPAAGADTKPARTRLRIPTGPSGTSARTGRRTS